MIELADAIRQLREQLAAAVIEGKDERLRFGLEAIELELQVTATKKGTAGLKLWLIEAGAEGEIAKESVQKVKLVLKPEWLGGGDVKIAAEGTRAAVDGTALGLRPDGVDR